MRTARGAVPVLLAFLAAAGAQACGDSTTPVDDTPVEPSIELAFVPGSLAFGEGRSGSVELRNPGDAAAGPVELVALDVRDGGGNPVPGARLSVSPAQVPTLNPGAAREIVLTLDVPGTVAAGDYEVRLEARLEGAVVTALGTTFSVARGDGPVVESLQISGGDASARQGDVLTFGVVATDGGGDLVPEPSVEWSVDPPGAGLVTADGDFVGYQVGPARVIAAAGEAADTARVEVTSRGSASGSFVVEWNERIADRYTSDHWEHGDAAYTGTWGCRSGGRCGNALFVWDISSRTSPVLADSVIVDARVVNDVKVSADGSLAIITHEGSMDGQNGITLLDLSDPLAPAVITRFTAPDLSPGVHNVWIDGDHAYLVVDGSVAGSGLRVIDISDPAEPAIVASFYGGGSFLHDVYVRDGLAFLSHWDAGLIILDVGNGVAGGTPSRPVEVGRIDVPGYRVHNAWYWPEAEYVFVGDEIAVPGRVLVIDVSDLSDPRQVATFRRPGAAPHNFWVDEESEIAYFAWYESGLYAVDVSGRLLGELDRQERRVADVQYDAGGACISAAGTCAWAPQLHDGHVYVSDMNSGLWVLTPSF